MRIVRFTSQPRTSLVKFARSPRTDPSGLELLQKASVSMVKAIKGNGEKGAVDMYYKFVNELPNLTPVL